MSTWSRMSSARFSKEEESAIGPGSYEIPTALDERAVVIANGNERFLDAPESMGTGFCIFDELTSTPKPQVDSEKRKSLRRASSAVGAKENRMPSSMTPRADKEDHFEQEQLRRRLLDEEKRRAQAEAKAADLLLARKAAANAHAQSQSQERKIEQLQKELEDTSLAKREAQRRACDLEADRGRVKKALYEKEQQLVASQKSLNLAKAQLEERGKKLEEIAGDSEKMRQEANLLRQKLEEPRPAAQRRPSGQASPQRAEEALRSLHERFAAQTAQTEGQVRDLAKAQERLHQKILESASQASQDLAQTKERLNSQAEELETRRAQLYFALKQSERQEAQLEATIAVRDASLSATASMCRELEAALSAAKTRETALEGEIAAERAAKEAGGSEQLQLQKDLENLASQHAEACGKLFTAESAITMCRKHNEELLAQLASSTDQAETRRVAEAAEMERQETAIALCRKQNEELRAELASCRDQAETRQAEQAAEMDRLRADLYDALAGRAEANQALKAKEARVVIQVQELEELQLCIGSLRQKSLEAEKRADAANTRSLELEKEVREVESLRAAAAEAESARAKVQQKEEEVAKLQKDYQELSQQNAELMTTLEAQQGDAQQLIAELGALREAEAQQEGHWAKVMAEHTSAGHSNHRQKIQHIIDLKEGNHSLRAELKKARQRIAQLEVATAGEVAARVAGGRRCSGVSTPPRAPQLSGRGASGRQSVQYPASLAEETGASKDKAYERLCLDFRHLLWMLERAATFSASALTAPSLSLADGGTAAFLLRLGDMAKAERVGGTLKSSSPNASQALRPATPERRQSFLDGLSDLGSDAEAPDAASDMEVEDAAATRSSLKGEKARVSA